MPKSHNPQSVTVQMKHIPQDLRDELVASGNRAGLLTDMLKELQQLRANVPPLSTVAQAHAIKLDLKGAERALKTQTAHVNELERRLEKTCNEKRAQRESMRAVIDRQAKEINDLEMALGHSIHLVNYLNKKGHEWS